MGKGDTVTLMGEILLKLSGDNGLPIQPCWSSNGVGDGVIGGKGDMDDCRGDVLRLRGDGVMFRGDWLLKLKGEVGVRFSSDDVAFSKVGVAVEGEGVRKSTWIRGSGVSPASRGRIFEGEGVGVEVVESDEGEDGVGVGVLVAFDEEDGLCLYCFRLGAGA